MSTRWDHRETQAHKQPVSPEPGSKQAAQAPWHRGLDPYFRWAQLTRWRGFTVHAGWERVEPKDSYIQILARAKDQDMLNAVLACGWLLVSCAYRNKIPGTISHALFFSARVARIDEDKLVANELGLRWELALPLRDAERQASGSTDGFFGPSRSLVNFQAANAAGVAIRAVQPLDLVGSEPQTLLLGAVAVIDFGCPFLNQRFVTDDKPGLARVMALWDQGGGVRSFAHIKDAHKRALAEQGWPWLVPQNFDYGREMGPKALQALVECARDTQQRPLLDERDIYRSVDYLIDYEDPRRRIWSATHGGHVLDVAGGGTDPLSGSDTEHSDPASWAGLVFVQLPSLTAADSSGGALSAHLLDGVRYALSVSEPGEPLVVNISYGTFAGPHDGSSMIEAAMDELLAQRSENFAIVLAAGNARDAHCHARRQVRHERSALLRCWMAAGDTTDTFVEIWYTDPKVDANLEARVRGPNRQWSQWVAPGEHDLLRDSGRARTVVAMLRHDRWVPNADPSMVLFAIAPTGIPADVPTEQSDAGMWEIELRMVGRGSKDQGLVEVQAWIERDDPGYGQAGARPYFLDQLADDEVNTLSSIATGQWTLAAGGFNLGTGQATHYSSLANLPQMNRRRMVLAGCEEDETTPSIAAAAVRSAEVYRMNGTSVAAPALARRIYKRMVEGALVSHWQWPKVLRAMVKAQASERPILKEPEVE